MHGQIPLPATQCVEQRQSVHARHAHIDQCAAAVDRIVAFEECLRGREHLRAQAAQSEQQSEGVAHRGIIIDNEDRRFHQAP